MLSKLDKMNENSDRNKNVNFTSDAWTALSEYEKRRFENVQKNFEILKASGITPKMPEFLMRKFKRPQSKRLKMDADSAQPKVFGTKYALDVPAQKTHFKLFGVPQQTAPRNRKCKQGASNDLIPFLKQKNTSPKNEQMIAPTVSLRNANPKEFAQALLGSAQNILKLLEEKMQKNSPYPIKDLLLPYTKFLPGESQKGRYPKRNIQRKCYKEENVPDQDEYLHCDVCNGEYEGVCPVHGPMLLVCDTKVRKDDPQKARKSLPLTLSIGFSSIKGAGLGVWTEMPLVAGVVFGPYKGKVVKKGGAGVKESGYAWQVRRETKTSLYVEGVDEGSSNWMRYVNYADSEEWQNVVAFQYKGAIYYRTYKPVLPYTEILVWYGSEYASHLGIDVRQKKLLPPPKEITGFQCEACDALFSSQEALQRHRKKHPLQGLKKHRCPECSYSTDNTGHLRRHLLTHSGERPHACDQCHQRFSREGNLRRHLLVHTGEKRHECGICGSRFAREESLRLHERVHSGERPYRCSDCGKDFSQAHDLKRHQMLHTRQRPYPCPHCEYRSTLLGNLKNHVASAHTGVFPHHCDLCGKGFHAPGLLRDHAQKKHQETRGSDQPSSH